MLQDAMQLLQDYGWAALFLFIIGGILARYVVKLWPVWSERNKEQIKKEENSLQDELSNHQFFSNINFKINNEIDTLDFNSNDAPIRQKLFRKLLELRLKSMLDQAYNIIKADINDISPSQWAAFVISSLEEADVEFEELALKAGIPAIVIKKFLVSHYKTGEILTNYVNDLAVSVVYGTNMARTNTLLYLMNLKLITTVGDAERTLDELNGEISGMAYDGGHIEEM